MQEPTDTIKRRATANALWTPLRHALMDGWPVVTDWSNHDPRGNPHSSDYNPGGVGGPEPVYLPTNEIGRVIARLEPNDWPGNGLSLAAYLLETDYDRAHATLDDQAQAEWVNAWAASNARQPFLVDKNRHGNPTLRRNHDPKALITSSVAAFLEAVAARAQVQLLTPEQDDAIYRALLDDAALEGKDLDRSRPSEVFAIAKRSGIDLLD